jgi:predicted N-acetyltransferase YhbS
VTTRSLASRNDPTLWEKGYLDQRPGERPSHVHVRVVGRPNHRYPLLVRDYLRAHPTSAAAYAEMKRRLAALAPNSGTYAEMKDPACDLIYLAAEAWASSSGWTPTSTTASHESDAGKMTAVAVRIATPEDRPIATHVERLAFEAARGGGSADDIVAGIEAVHAEPGSFGALAVEDATVVGHAQVSRAWIGSTPVVHLGPVGVSPRRWRRGIGSALIRFALQESEHQGEVAIVLLGDPTFYGRFGFVPASRYGLRNPRAGIQPNGFVVEEHHFQIATRAGPHHLYGAVSWHPAL